MGDSQSKAASAGRIDDNLETFSLAWLDAHMHTSEDNQKTQRQLRKIINHLKTFDDLEKCRDYITSLSSQDRLVLVVSGRCGQELVPQIHSLRQVSAIFVYCMDKQTHEAWAKKFDKVKEVVVQRRDLVGLVKTHRLNQGDADEPLPINVLVAGSQLDKSTTGLNGHFIHTLLLMDVLLRMKPDAADRQALIALCKSTFEGNDAELVLIDEFEREYVANRALWWYTRESFLYRMLNKALRVHNIDVLFLFRSVIADIYRQAKSLQCSAPVRVYRGQRMSIDELNVLRESEGKLISINSFFSTSAHRDNALVFLHSSPRSNEMQRVLFEIDADPVAVKAKPFADVSLVSDYCDEREILFMVGCVFRLTRIQRDTTKDVWIIEMRLCGEDEHDLQGLFQYMKQECAGGNSEANLYSFASVVLKMGHRDLAEKMYRRLLDETCEYDQQLAELYRSLGEVSLDKDDHESSHYYLHQALHILLDRDPDNYVRIASVCCWLGMLHRSKGDSASALDYYQQAIELFERAHDTTHPTMASLQNNLATVHFHEGRHTQALTHYQAALAIQRSHLPHDHPNIATAHNNIGCVYHTTKRYSQAIESFVDALTIRLKSLAPEDLHIAESYRNISSAQEMQGMFAAALGNSRKAADIYQRHALSAAHPDVIQINKQIERLSNKLK